MSRDRLSELVQGNTEDSADVGLESKAVDKGVEIHYDDDGDYEVHRVEGSSSNALIDNLMEKLNELLGDDDVKIKYLAVPKDD